MKQEALRFQSFFRKKLPMILQEESMECGHACVAMISNYFGHHLDLYGLRGLQNTSSLGVNLLDIKNLCQNLGFLTRALRVSIEELALVKTPAILHWNMNHFIVLKQVKNNKVIVHDPALGVRHCSWDEVSRCFTGIALEIEPSQDFSKIHERKKLKLSDLIKNIQGLQTFLSLLILLSLLIEVLSLLSPLLMQYVTDDVLATAESNNLYTIGLAFVILLIFQTFIEYIRGNMIIYLSMHLTEQFSSNLMQHLLKLPLDFFEKRHKGDIQTKFQSIDQIQKKISVDFMNALLDGFLILVHVAVMLIYSLPLTMLVAISISLYGMIRYASYQALKKQTQNSIFQHAQAATLFLETLRGIIPIKSFLKEGIRINTWRNAYIQALNADIRISKMQVIYQAMNHLLFHGEHILLVCCGAFLVLSQTLTVGMLLAFLSYRLLLINKASALIQNVFDYKLISVQLNRLADILFQSPEKLGTAENKCSLLNTLSLNYSLSLKNISFRYHQASPYILKKINLDVEAGEKIAIIGPSGCGKSTLLKIMLGLLSQTEGDMVVGGQTLEDFGLINYRKLTASVMQDDTLLSGSILNNIAFFEEHIDIERVYQVAQMACIHESIQALPMKYETLVGDMGSTLSGGQKQRVLLARALYKQPKFLFLDEASSHLDLDNEIKINQTLKALKITQIIIAHRQETIQLADRVIDLTALMR